MLVWSLAQVFTPDWAAELRHVPVLLIRTVIAFAVVMFVVRWTGKRSISNLAPFDLAMVIMIGEVAAIPVSDLDVDFLHGLFPVVLIGLLHLVMTTVNLHSKTFERLTEGRPTLLVKDGRILKENLLKERVSIADLLTALRQKEVTDISKVREAWIEHTGGISVLLKREADYATPLDVERAVERIVDRGVGRILGPELDRRVEEAVRRAMQSYPSPPFGLGPEVIPETVPEVVPEAIERRDQPGG